MNDEKNFIGKDHFISVCLILLASMILGNIWWFISTSRNTYKNPITACVLFALLLFYVVFSKFIKKKKQP
jgi:membrane protein DedA with SNARE-associated domain